MRETKLLELALGLVPPWGVVRVEFRAQEKRLDIWLDFPKGSRFACPVCGELCAVYDTEEREWRHLNFFEHECYLHARSPRTDCGKCGVHVVEVPWSRSGSGFSLLFEALIMILSREMPVAAVSRLIGESDNRIWRVIEHHVDEARRELDVSDVEHVGMDETSRKRGHNYMTLFVDMDARRVIDVESGMKNLNLETVRSYHIRENFKEFYTREDSPAAEEHLKSWFWWATHSRIEEMREAAWTIKRHWEGVMNWHRSKLSNGLLEALNSLFQAAKAKARGYRSFRKIKTIVYLLLGKLQYKLPELLPT